jgi:hypothetical protein
MQSFFLLAVIPASLTAKTPKSGFLATPPL